MSSGDSRPPSDDSSGSSGPSRTVGSDTGESLLTRFRTAQNGPLMFLREMLTSVLAVVAIGLLLFAVSGVWPPMVAVESGSMEPHMQKGDLIFITEPGRFAPDSAHGDTGVVTYEAAQQTDYRTFGSYGSVVIYDNPDSFGPPIIHRARFWVDEGENWYDEANPEYVRADNCEELRYCPAPHAGFVTKGDNNAEYDQANGISPPVRPEWVQGIARVRIPYLGWVRLGFSGAAFATPADGDVEMTTGGGGAELVSSNTTAVERSEASEAGTPASTSQVQIVSVSALPASTDPTNATSESVSSKAIGSTGTVGAIAS
jgi:signal peptidase